MTIKNWLKQLIWWIIWPFFPLVRDIFRKLGYHPYPDRQKYHLGWLKKTMEAEELLSFLKKKGYSKNRLAWIDKGEKLSLRLKENFSFQYHIRLFSDREIRAHYELTPEYSPLGHLHDKETAPKTEYFTQLLEKFLTDSPK